MLLWAGRAGEKCIEKYRIANRVRKLPASSRYDDSRRSCPRHLASFSLLLAFSANHALVLIETWVL